MNYLAVIIKGDVFIINDCDELGGLIDLEIEHETIGEVCREECSTDCHFFCSGTCPYETMKDVFGQPFKVKKRADL